MTGFALAALAFVAIWLFLALLEADHERRRAVDRMETWRKTALLCSEDANDARAKLAAALRSLQAIEEAQRHVLGGYVAVEVDGRKIVLFRN